MGVLHDFECEDGHLTEQFVSSDTQIVPCERCPKPASRVYLRAPRLDWLGMAQGSNAGPEFVDRFDRVHKKEKARQEKILATHGDYGPGYEPPP
jgi:hypothetical protein